MNLAIARIPRCAAALLALGLKLPLSAADTTSVAKLGCLSRGAAYFLPAGYGTKDVNGAT